MWRARWDWLAAQLSRREWVFAGLLVFPYVFFLTPAGRGAMLRAYDKMNGKEVGAVYIPAPQSGSPMSYMLNGEQYLVLAVSGAGYSGELLAFKLPKE